MTDLHPSSSDPDPKPVDETPTSGPQETSEEQADDPELQFDWGRTMQDSIAQIEVVLQEIPHRSQRLFQQTLASLQLRLGGQAKELQERLLTALAPTRIAASLDQLRDAVQEVTQVLTPGQMEVLIASLPMAADRALVASLYTHLQQGSALPDPHHLESAARAYGLSGLPIVIGADEQVRVEASAALVGAIISIQIAGATASTALSFIGTPELRRLLKADEQLRSTAMSQGRKLLPQEGDWRVLHQLLNRSDPEANDSIVDGPLALTQLGIEGAQLAEFVGQQIKTVLNIGLLRAFTPPILMEALQLLTSDLLFAVGISVESALESTGAARRVELVLEALPKAQRIPTPEQVLTYAPTVLQEADRTLKPLLGKQILSAADGLDPQMRNATLNQIGQQLNLWNPFQFLGGWQGREWLSGVKERLQALEMSYPTLESLQIYTSGMDEALEVYRVMEQAQILRSLARQVDPNLPGE